MRNSILIVRAGDRSFHPGWLSGKGARKRRFDLHISYYGDNPDPFPDRPADVTVSFEKGACWTGVGACLEKLGDRLDRYDWIGFPDDDLAADCATWNRFFEIIDELKPQLAQPALHWRSFYTWEFLIQRFGIKARWTNFIEIMMPVMSQEMFRRVRHTLGANASGFGYDFWWPRLLEPKERSMLVVDETPVLHTRKCGVGALHNMIKETGLSSIGERDAFFIAHDVPGEYPPAAYTVVLPDGRERPATADDQKRSYVAKKVRKWRRGKRDVDQVQPWLGGAISASSRSS